MLYSHFSHDSQKIIQFLDGLPFSVTQIDKKNALLKTIYKKCLMKFKTLDLHTSKIRRHTTTRKKIPEKQCYSNKIGSYSKMIQLIKNINDDPFYKKYLLQNHNVIEKERLHQFLASLDDNQPQTYYDKWLHRYGKKILNNINYLIQFNKLPPQFVFFLNSNKDIYNCFCSLDIQKEIENNLQILCRITTTHYLLQIRTYKMPPTKKTYHTIHQYIMMFLSCFTNKVELEPSNKVKVDIYLTNKKKMFPKEYRLLGPKEVNTGSTISGPKGKINIWRKEEVYKLILHEMMHYHQFDVPREIEKKVPSIHSYLHQVFNIPKRMKININEAYVETITCILHSLFMSYIIGDKSNIRLFIKYIQYEQLFSCFQIAKIVLFYGYETYEEFYHNEGVFRVNSKWQQSSHVFSYYVVKGAFLYSIIDFIDFCMENNKPNQWIHFNSNKPFIYENLFLLLKKSITNRHFIETITKCMDYIRENQNNKKFVYKTLRMTAIELT